MATVPHTLETVDRALVAWRPWAARSRTMFAPATIHKLHSNILFHYIFLAIDGELLTCSMLIHLTATLYTQVVYHQGFITSQWGR